MAARVRCGAVRQPRARGGSAPAEGGRSRGFQRRGRGCAVAGGRGASSAPHSATGRERRGGEAAALPSRRCPQGPAQGGTSRADPRQPGSWPSSERAGAERRTPTGQDGNVPVPPAVRGERLGGRRRAGSGAARSIASHRIASHRIAWRGKRGTKCL